MPPAREIPPCGCVDEGPGEQRPGRHGEQPVELGDAEDAMAEPDDDRGDAAAGDRAQQQMPAVLARRQVKRDQEHRERRRRTADVGARAGGIEAERPGAAGHERRCRAAARCRADRGEPAARAAAGSIAGSEPAGAAAAGRSEGRREANRRPCQRLTGVSAAMPTRDGDHQADHASARWTPPTASGAATTAPTSKPMPTVAPDSRRDRRAPAAARPR